MTASRRSRWRIILTAWPWQAACFIAAAFGLTIWRLLDAIAGDPANESSRWLEPLAAVLGGIGAFVLAAILIFKRVDGARSEADSYNLARGLAAGYYFNFIRPLLQAIRDPQHSIQDQIAGFDHCRVKGLVIGVPDSLADFDPDQHEAIFQSLTHGIPQYELHEIKVAIANRPRPVIVRVAINRNTRAAVIVDVPTTLYVIADFAEFFAAHGTDAGVSDDEFIHAARKANLVTAEAQNFEVRLEQTLEHFQEVVSKVGSMEPPGLSVATLVHIVSIARLKHRLNELSGV